MGENCDLSFCELRAKEIINTFDGSRLGRLVDIIFSVPKGEIKGIVVPYCRRWLFSRSQEIFIPWKCINKIGEDVILVCLIDDGFVGQTGRGRRRRHDQMREFRSADKHDEHGGHGGHGGHSDGFGGHNKSFNIHSYNNDDEGECRTHSFSENEEHCEDNKPPNLPNCDRKCEKCMLFDCEYRWKLD